jgi:hypothetical protein
MACDANNKAREHFKAKGLTYENITEGDIIVLAMLLNKHVKAANKRHEMSTDSMRMSQKIVSKYKRNGTLISCYLYINSNYFTQREAISFNTGGFIGFCGWADDRNTAPIVAAFMEWVDCLAAQEVD